ncbi:MAG: hypothetical protein DRQ35_01170 [Gammaproteobacteria bacterium]|nr:MAG: hypothetical protein DRQ35_01170 [Gammaproteobacteria bacterium]
MTDLIQLKKYRYRGIDLLFTDTTTSGGNRIVRYNYPGSDKQAVEVQGKAPRSFSITTIIPYENYDSNRANLIRVLEDGKKGVLTHPYWGDIENVITGSYSLNEKLSELGRASITIQFEVDDAEGIPIQSGNLQTLTEYEANLLGSVSVQDIVENYIVRSGFIGNFGDAMENVQNVADAFNEVSERATQIQEQASTFYADVDNFERNIVTNIKNPALLGPEINDLFYSLGNLYDTPEQKLIVYKGLFLFGEDDPEIIVTTAGLKSRKNNRDVIRSAIRTQSLAFAYDSAVQVEYDTTDELDLIQSELEQQYLTIRNDELVANDVHEQLDRTRVQAIKTLDDARVTTNQVITVTTQRQPLSVLLYQWYGNTDLFDIITELNDIHQNAFVEGDIKILVVA